MSAETEKIRDVVTPEGVSLPFEIAAPTDRLTAFFADFMLIHLVAGALFLAGAAAAGSFGGEVALSVAMLLSFFLRTFYFSFFEIRLGGTTLGKRQMGLRVISRDGGPLTAEAVLARNLTRELEVFLPLSALAAPEALLPGLPAWAALLGCLWLLLFGLLPFFGRDKLRVGDILAGTIVVRMPTTKLMEDLAETKQLYDFTREQLDLYGIKELQVLEELLRRSQGYREQELVEEVAGRIMKKIGWPDAVERDDRHDFLSAFYKAQRARLEHKMLFGKRQTEKKR